MQEIEATIDDPCSGVCQVDPQGLCMGCRRSREEIQRWRELADVERRHLLDTVLPERGWVPVVGHAH